MILVARLPRPLLCRLGIIVITTLLILIVRMTTKMPAVSSMEYALLETTKKYPLKGF